MNQTSRKKLAEQEEDAVKKQRAKRRRRKKTKKEEEACTCDGYLNSHGLKIDKTSHIRYDLLSSRGFHLILRYLGASTPRLGPFLSLLSPATSRALSSISQYGVESVGEADGHHRPLCQLPGYRRESAPDGPVWRASVRGCVLPSLFA